MCAILSRQIIFLLGKKEVWKHFLFYFHLTILVGEVDDGVEYPTN